MAAITKGTNYYHYFDSSKKWGICAYLQRYSNRVGVYVFDWQHQEAMLAELAKDRPEIESKFGRPMAWGKSYIGADLDPGNPDEKSDWPRQHQWLTETMADLKSAMYPSMSAARTRA